VPMRLVETFQYERSTYGHPPSLLVQPALAQFMEQGQFAVHIRRMRRLYATRRQALLDVLMPHHGKLFNVDAPPSGLTIMLRLKDTADDDEIVVRLGISGIEVQALSSYYAGRKKRRGLLLSFAGFTEKELVVAGKKLVSLL
jgi:GntR family transcriptional regulator / MocR family aminotransferase